MSDVGLLSERLTAAFEMARDVHDGDGIKGTSIPYMTHLLDVCSLTLRHGGDEDQAIAALLHDVVEDGGGRPMLEEIRTAFGDRVAHIVEACTDSFEIDPAQKPDWWERKVAYIDHLEAADADVALVSGSDKLSNIRSLVADHAVHGDAFFDRFRTGRMGTLWYYRRIAEVLPARLTDTDGLRRLGQAYLASVDALLEAVGEGAREDWDAGREEEAASRNAMADRAT